MPAPNAAIRFALSTPSPFIEVVSAVPQSASEVQSNGLGVPLTGPFSHAGSTPSWKIHPPSTFRHVLTSPLAERTQIPTDLRHGTFTDVFSVAGEEAIPEQNMVVHFVHASPSPEKESRGLLVWMPGLMSNNLVESDIVPHCTAKGFHVVIIDPMGSGFSDSPINKNGKPLEHTEVNNVINVTEASCRLYNKLINTISAKLGGVPVVLAGHSKGGAKAKMMAAQKGEHAIQNLKAVVPFNSVSSDDENEPYDVPPRVALLASGFNLYNYRDKPLFNNLAIVKPVIRLLGAGLTTGNKLRDANIVSARILYPHFQYERGLAFLKSRVEAILFDANVAVATLSLKENQLRMQKLSQDTTVPVVEVLTENDPLIEAGRVIRGQLKNVADYTSLLIGSDIRHMLPQERPEIAARVVIDAFEGKFGVVPMGFLRDDQEDREKLWRLEYERLWGVEVKVKRGGSAHNDGRRPR